MIQSAPFFKINIILILGIMFSRIFPCDIVITGFLLLSSCILLFLKYQPIIYSFSVYISVFLIGTLIYQIHSKVEITPKHTGVYLEILQPKTQKKDYKNYYGKVLYLNNDSLIAYNQKVYLTTFKNEELQKGDIIYVPKKLMILQKQQNPHSFDFNTYLIHQHIRLKLNTDTLHLIKEGTKNTIHHTIKKRITSAFPQYLHGISLSLLLGKKKNLTAKEKSLFQKTGSMHLLALSGMHVGVIVLLLQSLFFWKKYLSQNISIVFILIEVILLWLYAYICGFSPSIVRAVFMFSILIIGKLFKRDHHLINTLCFSSFCFLLYDPFLLFDIGFQLSFSAVFFISLFPYWDRIQNYSFFKRAFCSVIIVSFLAQLGTISITTYNFHHIPLYSLLSSLLSGILITLLMYSGLFILFLESINRSSKIGIQVYDLLYQLLKNWLNLFYQLPQLPTTSLHSLTSIFLFIGILFFFYSLFYKKYIRVVLILAVLSFFSEIGFTIYDRQKSIYFYASKVPAFSIVQGSNIFSYILKDSTQSHFINNSIIKPHQQFFSLTSTKFLKEENKNKAIEIIIDSTFRIKYHKEKYYLYKENSLIYQINQNKNRGHYVKKILLE